VAEKFPEFFYLNYILINNILIAADEIISAYNTCTQHENIHLRNISSCN